MSKVVKERYDVVVCGGGLAGFCAAVAAARKGASTCLIQDRPVFGGNSSSEVRVTPHGAAANNSYARETGIISELLIEERMRNHETIKENGWTNSIWDLTMYDMAAQTENLVFYLNTTVHQVIMDTERRIRAVVARVANAETEMHIEGAIFIDSTGDGVVADLAGCQWRWGSEGRSEFGEPHAPLAPTADTMGNSIHFRAKDMGRPMPFTPPVWAVKHDNPDYFEKQGRFVYDLDCGYWWIEIGIPWNTIYDNETIRHELTRHTLGIWDWIKNRDPQLKEKARNFALDWIGQIPGKRESRRVEGEYLMTEHDPSGNTKFPDEIAFGGWGIDLHTPGGLLAPTSEPSSAEGYDESTEYAIAIHVQPYGIPLRTLIARDVDNLMLAGRNISVTRAALGTVRVMGTTALMGQAAGTAAAIALRKGIAIKKVPEEAIGELQQTLLRDGCFLPNVPNSDELDVARQASVSASSSAVSSGAGPDNLDHTGGLIPPTLMRKPSGVPEPVTYRRGQWIAVGADEIRRLAVCVSNDTDEPQVIQLVLSQVEQIWDYRVDTQARLAETAITVPAGASRWWADWADIGLNAAGGLRKGTYVRLDVLANPNVQWHSAGTFIPGHPSAYEYGAGKMRRYTHWGLTQSFRIEPAQACYEPENVISGVARPQRFTNVWRSNPIEPLDQWLQLEWEQEQQIGQVVLTFPGHVLNEYHRYPALYRDPQCPKDYSIQAWIGGGWQNVLAIKDNYQRHLAHKLPQAVTTKKLRLVVHATNGDPSAALYEIRCYE